jgi:redox-sensitive bicupin YhaK (pirin superfamily)
MARMRHVAETIASQPTMEGAGVKLRRAFGVPETPRFDPFLLLDDFRGESPQDYEAGFPWHPHRGIETITYMVEGSCAHGDSMGNSGVIGEGDVQWMTAGGGIIHQEMPAGDTTGRMGGFQLWANLPAANKMMDARYRGIEACDIPEISDGAATVRVVAGEVAGVRGPVTDVVIDPEYLDVTLGAGTSWRHDTPAGHTVFAYVTEGELLIGEGAEKTPIPALSTALLTDGEALEVSAGTEGARFLLVSGKPLGEPVAWRGPIVMNSDEELREAFREYREGTFVRHETR